MPTYVRSSGQWLPVSGSVPADINTIASANQVIYKNSSNIPTGSVNLTFNGSNLSCGGNINAVGYGNITSSGYGFFVTPNAGSTGGVRIAANATSGIAYLQFTNNAQNAEWTNIAVTNGAAVFSGSVSANSDIKLKTNVKTISNPLDKVSRLRGVEYDRIDYDSHEIGVIAQEVEKVIPEVVTDNSGTKAVAYGNLVGLLIEAIKEQNQKIDSLTEEINSLKNGGK
jgi:hypothetical protein